MNLCTSMLCDPPEDPGRVGGPNLGIRDCAYNRLVYMAGAQRGAGLKGKR